MRSSVGLELVPEVESVSSFENYHLHSHPKTGLYYCLTEELGTQSPKRSVDAQERPRCSDPNVDSPLPLGHDAENIPETLLRR
jgi:hypothetical protein